MPRKG